MARMRAVACMALLLVGTGCPSNWRPDGHFDRARHKDMREFLKEGECPPGQSPREICKEDSDGNEVCEEECA